MDVLELTVARTKHMGLDARLQSSAERITRLSTVAFARWLAGEAPDVARDASSETWLFYGELAARRTASLNNVIRHCYCWRDAVSEVLEQCAVQLELSPQALARALSMLQAGLELGFIQISNAFDDARQRTDEELAFMATHDELTRLPNRTLIRDRAEQMLARGALSRARLSVLLIDIDNVKAITDTLGHEAGDQLTRTVAARLLGAVRGVDTLGCLGASEFVVVCEEPPLAAEPELTAERLLAVLQPPFKLDASGDTQFTVSASIGIAVGERTTADELLHRADVALHQAKGEGENRYVVFEAGMKAAVQRRVELESALREALPNNEFFLVYQPTFDLRDMKPTGVEALIRWRRASGEIVTPADFIPLLESSQLIIDVGAWVLQEACRQGALWRNRGHALGMAINVSARQLDTDEFVTAVRDALADSGLEASALTLEVTETTLMRNVKATARRLAAIRELGVRIAIDDFGTGYSSLSHLQQFPVDSLKIDRAFVSQMTQSHEGRTLIHILVQLGKALSIETLAEGIERQQELVALQEEQCDSGQGFLYARPMEACDLEAFLATGPRGTAGALAGQLAPRLTAL